MRSELELSELRSDLTLFNGFFDTRPAMELNEATFGEIVANIAPCGGPSLMAEKESALYFVPCCLKVAPLVNGTRAKAGKLGLPLIGKQRSAAHVTDTNIVVADLDGIAAAQEEAIEGRLKNHGLTYLLYSTYSHGKSDKPGIRCRLLLPVDMALDSASYKLAAAGLNAVLLGGLADPSGFALHQQQGVWATAPERENQAFRRFHKAGVANAAALIAAAPKAVMQSSERKWASPASPTMSDAQRVIDALGWLSPNEYKVWIDAAIWLKAAYGDAAYQAWLNWGESADATSKGKNDGDYAPEKVWAGIEPRINSDQGAGALFAHARDAAVAAIRQASETGQWDRWGQSGVVYLRRYHFRHYQEMFEVAA